MKRITICPDCNGMGDKSRAGSFKDCDTCYGTALLQDSYVYHDGEVWRHKPREWQEPYPYSAGHYDICMAFEEAVCDVNDRLWDEIYSANNGLEIQP